MTIASLVVDVNANIANLTKSVDQIHSQVDGVGQHLSTFSGLVERMTERFLIYETLRKVFDFSKEILESTAKLEDLSLATGISREGIQKLGYVGQEFGVDLEQMARGVEQLSAKLAGGDKSAVLAVQMLGLSVKDLIASGPEEAFLAFAEATGRVADPMLKGAIAADGFGGKLAKTLLPALGELREKMGDVPRGAIISDENIKAAHDFDVGIQHLTTTTKAWIVEGLSGLSAALGLNMSSIYAEADAARKAAAATTDMGKAMDPAAARALAMQNAMTAWRTEGVEPLNAEQRKTIDIGLSLGKSLTEIARVTGVSEGALHTYADAHKAAGKAMEDAAKDADKAAKSYRELQNWIGERDIQDAEKALKAKEKLEDEYRAYHNFIGERMLEDDAKRLAKENELAAAQLGVTTNSMTPGYTGPSITDNQASHMSDTFLDTFGMNLQKQLPKTIIRAFEGGGNVIKSVLGTAGAGFSQAIFGTKQFMNGVISHLGEGLGGAVNAILPGVGALVAPLVNKILNIFSGGEGHQTNVNRDNWITQNFGTVQQLQQLGAQAGIADGVMRQLFSTGKVADFQRIAGQVQDQLKQYADEQAADATRLEAAIKKYGFAFEELGPKFQQQNLDGQAKELIEDWRVLVGSGIDLDLVNTKMAKSINDYLQMALTTGAEVPVAMQPILQKMVEQGLLMDANGVAITDLGQLNVTWSESMTQGFDRVVTKLQELIDHLNATGQALNNIPKQVTTTITTVHEDVTQANQKYADPRYLPGGEFYVPPDYSNVESFASGTNGFQDFGTGRLVRTHGEELILPKSKAREAAGNNTAGGDSGLKQAIDGLRRDLRDNIRLMPIAIRDALIMAR